MAASHPYRVTQLARLNRDLDELYELLYSQWDSVTENDYQVFGMQLQIMLGTLKDLHEAYGSVMASWKIPNIKNA